ncbi:uncharacterized protein ZBAI_05938 [Zygosaccharomyces bailii ISA1307]|nr:uncharacterized protein ZBAI_05938 [Zygosaccharomyces bailii ISA1307]
MHDERHDSKVMADKAMLNGSPRHARSLKSVPSRKCTNEECESDGWSQLPTEIVTNILALLDPAADQSTLVQCLFVSRSFHHGAKQALYSRPHFTSTYRVAQFITCIRHCESSGLLVKQLDLSQLRNGDSSFVAGWRDWRLRHITPVRSRRPSSVLSLESGSTTGSSRGYRSNSSVSSFSSSSGGSRESLGEPQGKWASLWTKFKRGGRDKVQHKLRESKIGSPSPYLLTHSRSRSSSSATYQHANRGMSQYPACKDLPLGHVLHLLRICRNLVSLDLSHLALSADFELPQSGQPQPRSMVPGVSVEPRAMYLTDSTRPLDNTANLKKLNPEQLFDILLERANIRTVRMDHIVWVRQSMVADFVLRSYQLKRTSELSFNRSGLQRHLAWTCEGDLQDLVALVLMDYVVGLDNLALQQLFPTKHNTCLTHPDIMEISQVFDVPLNKDVFPARLTVLRGNKTGYRLRKLCPQYLSLVVSLAESGAAVKNVIDRRLYKRARNVSKRLKELRNTDLRRSMGQNYLLPGAEGIDV